jgi:adenylate kinase
LNAIIANKYNGESFILLGPPGAGKSTQGNLLSKNYNGVFFSFGELFRKRALYNDDFGKEIQSVIKTGGIISTEIFFKVLDQKISTIKKNELLFFDFAGSSLQCEMINQLLTSIGRQICAAILINLDDNEIVKRLIIRNREDDNLELIKYRLELYKREIKPVFNYLQKKSILNIVDGKGSIEDVLCRVKNVVDKYI